MKTKKIVILIFIIVSQNLFCQINQKVYYKDLHNNFPDLDSIISERLKIEKNQSYFVITYPMCAAITSWGNQLYHAYNSIKNRNEKKIIILSNQGGIRKKDINIFLKKILKISDEEISQLTLIWDDELHDKIQNERDLIRLIYIFRGNIYYDEAPKFNVLNENILPTEQLKIIQNQKIFLKIPDSLIIKKNDKIFNYKNGHLLLLNDISNKVYDINILDGKLNLFFDIRKYITPFDLYNDKILKNKSLEKYEFAKKAEKGLKKENRETLQVSKLWYNDGILYGTFSLEIMEISNKEDKFLSDERKELIQKKGKPILQAHQFFFKFNLDKEKLETFLIDIPDGKEDIYANIDLGFFVKKDTIYCGVTRYPQPKKPQKHIAKYTFDTNHLRFIEYMEPSTKDDDFLVIIMLQTISFILMILYCIPFRVTEIFSK
ncbi:MAG: hypothetical protein JST62_00380 [Bacteroidetes bacterium]|nr:hypothetical protein [Bacteroidota bacterium]